MKEKDIQFIRNRIDIHAKEQAKRISRPVDEKCFFESIEAYVLEFARWNHLTVWDFEKRNDLLKDSFFKGRANTMDLLAFETIKQILNSEKKKNGLKV